MKKIDVCAIGELLIDFTQNGVSQNGNMMFEANPGGAPCNVLAMLAKLGKKAAFIGKVGSDFFGEMLVNRVEEAGIATEGIVKDPNVFTTLAFVHTLACGEREFSFVRNPGADMMLNKSDVNLQLIRDAKIFHFGTLSSTHPGVREATRYALDEAEKSGAVISFDPNLRKPLWSDLSSARAEIEYGLSKCNVLKISDDEVEFLLDTTDYDSAAQKLFNANSNIKLIFITLGGNGSCAYTRKTCVKMPAMNVEAIEKTGAGDTFFGCALNYLLEHDIDSLNKNMLEEMLCFANTGAAIITTRKGALSVMPEKGEILKMMGTGIKE